MVETAVSEEDHVTLAVRSWTEPSVYVPVALNSSVVPSAITGSEGVTSSELSAALEIVSKLEPVMPVCVAEIVELPTATLSARPSVPGVFETWAVATEESQVTSAVRSWVVPSVKVPVAVNC
jgi:hypothetical protein